MKFVRDAVIALVIGVKTLVAVALFGSLATDRGGPDEAL
jgi:hypothetical protein